MAAENLPVQVACKVLGASESGFYEHLNRAPSERSIRHAMLTDLISQIHLESHGIYGARRVHAELTLGRGVLVGHNEVELLMRRAGLQGLTGRRKWKRICADDVASDLVERDFNRSEPNQLWVTDIPPQAGGAPTEHPTREGKVYCCAILDTYSRRVVGWSIDESPTSALVTNALGMAIDNRLDKLAEPGMIIHSDHGVQFGSWAFTKRAKESGAACLDGQWRLLGQLHDRVVLVPHADRAPRSQEVEYPPRASERDVRVHRDLAQPQTPPQPTRVAHPDRV